MMLAPGAQDPHYEDYDDDDYDDDDRYEYENDDNYYTSRESDRGRNLRDVKEPVARSKSVRASSRVFDPEKIDNVLGFNTAGKKTTSSAVSETIISHPNGVEDAIQLGSHIRNGRMCIVDLTGLDKIEAQRIVDYLSGVCMALDGATTRVNHGIFTVSPPNHRVTATYGNPNPSYDDSSSSIFSSRHRDA